MDPGHGLISFEAALEVIEALAIEHMATTGKPLQSIVAFGGTALAAMAVRERSDDVDIYMNEVDDAVLDKVVNRFKSRFGPKFKIDATPSKQLFGAIFIEDVDASPKVGSVKCGGTEISVKALSAETMYIVKAAADRSKDQGDIEALAKRCTYNSTLKRARNLFPLYANRHTFPEYAERLARYMARDHHVPLTQVDTDFGLPEVVSSKIRIIRESMEVRFMQTLEELMIKRPELLTFDEKKPNTVKFNAKAAGATDEILAIIRNNPKPVADLAANSLKTTDPKRHLARMAAIKNAAKGMR